MFQPRNILVPTDFSPGSEQAFSMALEIAGEGHSRVFLLHVIGGVAQQCGVDYCLDRDIVDRILSESIVYSNDKLQELVAKFPESSRVKVISDVRRGVPHEEILKTAAERRIQLIVIASHGKTGLKKYLLGSVAERVMQEATCPVLLIRPREGEGSPPPSA